MVLLVALGLTMVRGSLVARRRHLDLQPARLEGAMTLVPGQVMPVAVARDERFVLLQLAGASGQRLALHQVFPERVLVRWIEPLERPGDLLLLPLAGLRDGTYALSLALPGEQAGPVEMDANPALRQELGSFALTRR